MYVLEKCKSTLNADCFAAWAKKITYRQGERDCDRSTLVNLLPWLLAAGTLLSKTLCLWSYFYTRYPVWHRFFFIVKSAFSLLLEPKVLLEDY